MAKVRGEMVRFTVDYPKYMELRGTIKDIRIIDNEVYYYVLCMYENDTQSVDVYRLVHQDNVY